MRKAVGLTLRFSSSIKFISKSYPRFISTNSAIMPREKSSAVGEKDFSVPKQYVFPKDQPVVQLECQTAFENLSNEEQQYAHHLCRASWSGSLIVLLQTSPESPLLFCLLHRIFISQSIPDLKKATQKIKDFTDDDFQAFLVYASGIFTNMGNYKGYGDTKFVPNLAPAKFEAVIKASEAWKKYAKVMGDLWNQVKASTYNLDKKRQQLGLGEKGITTYFSSNCTSDDTSKVAQFLKERRLEAYNQRILKTLDSQGKPVYDIRLASCKTEFDPEVTCEPVEFEPANAVMQVTRGDYAPILEMVVESLGQAAEVTNNPIQKEMLEQYIHSFTSGSLQAHKEGSRLWIRDRAPAVESYLGFIETYRDPDGQRGEFEGFVAMVNRPMSAKFAQLVENATKFLPLLPWPPEFEKDKFLKPDFTSLDVLAFAGSGIPSGINIPNYDEIRQSEGFKNVSLGNVIPANYKDTNLPFLIEKDKTLLNKYRVPAFEVQVGLHELLGHGSGKLFRKDQEGNMNFDLEKVKDPLTGERITSWYNPGETYDSQFTSMSSAYEECRAECVGLLLSLNNDVLKIFGHEGTVAEDIKYVNWLSLLWNPIGRALEMYQPTTSTWLQAHSQARFAILQVLLEAGEGLIQIVQKDGEDGQPDLRLSMNHSKLATVGERAISKFLQRLQVYKSTNNVLAAKTMFEKYTTVSEAEPYPFLKWREIVLARKQPQKMFVQPNTFINEDDKVSLRTYEATHEGLIQSWVDRFPSDDIDVILHGLAEKDKSFFN